MKDYRTVCPRDCFGTCGLKVQIKDGKVLKVKGDKDHPVTRGISCIKGNNFHNIVNNEGRLMAPLKRVGNRGEDKFEPISWHEAIDAIYENLSAIRDNHGPESVMYYKGSGTFGIARECDRGFWYQFGGFTTKEGSLCQGAISKAINLTYGDRKHNDMEDLINSDLIILWGKNPAFTHPQMMNHINKAVKNGSKLVTIDPRINESSKNSDLHLCPRPGTDGALALGIGNELIKSNSIDEEFINKYAYGYEEYKELVKDYSLEKVNEITEIDKEKIEKLVSLIKKHPKYALIMGFGVQRYTNGGQTSRAISLIPPLTGSIGKSGACLYVDNGQGEGFEWPISPEKPDEIRSIPIGKLATILGTEENPPIKGMWIQMANPLTSNPNTKRLRENMNNLDFVVVCDLFMTDTSKMADIVLPVASPFEYYDLIKSYGHPYIHLQDKLIDPPGQCKHESEIYKLLSKRFGFDEKYLLDNDEDLIKNILRESSHNVTIEELRKKPYLPKNSEDIAFENLEFNTQSGKIEFYCERVKEEWGASPLPEYIEPEEGKDSDIVKKYPLSFLTTHSKNRINSQYANVDELKEESILSINPKDAKDRHIENGDLVKIFNKIGTITLKAKITDSIKEGIVHVFFGNWENENGVNNLIKDRLTDIGDNTAFHNCVVQVEKI
ncbi:molybdopterin-containing oxidoreductase family protein [Anaeromicrobium sediminis]|uniref:4Fe-4S Mo/W bis-MGD-type domain-containing protein n=1 Tax=Anaeromicrobium sediminis TaxID=1478221 RepID=A0A267MM75_9FIRM|nr:molybdopterin-dependent oxidoreductase [Anaeromicrobium sediminis]PAB60008.1 hypothetical protein CCE28_06435 [Anaeromicrobium sediminis]